MVSIFVFIMPAIFALLLLIVTVAVYSFIYKRNINKALNDRDSVKRRMPPPYKVLIGAASVIIILTILFISVVRVNSGNNGGGLEDKYFAASYSFNVYQPDEMTGYLSAYSIEENVGYKKYVEDIGDVRVTYFMSEENYDVYPKVQMSVWKCPEIVVKDIIYASVEAGAGITPHRHLNYHSASESDNYDSER